MSKKKTQWHDWFAWYPVWVSPLGYRWLRKVRRRYVLLSWEHRMLNDPEATNEPESEPEAYWEEFRLIPVCSECDWWGLQEHRNGDPICPECGAETEEVSGRYKIQTTKNKLFTIRLAVDFKRRKEIVRHG